MTQAVALLVGATGLIGRHCLDKLLNCEHYSKVKILVRTPIAFEHPKLEQHQVNFEALEQSQQLMQATDVYCCLGTTLKVAGSKQAFRRVDFDYPLTIAKMAKLSGAKQFMVVSSMGANPSASMFYTAVKGELEAALEQLNYPALHIFRPSLLLGKRPGQPVRTAESIGQTLMTKLNFLLVGRAKSYRAIEAKTVANAMVVAALTEHMGTHRYHYDEIIALGSE